MGCGGHGADGNGNGVVDAADYTVWRNHFGVGPGSGQAANVPEPSTGSDCMPWNSARTRCEIE